MIGRILKSVAWYTCACILGGLFGYGLAVADGNTFQPFQPFSQAARARLLAGLPQANKLTFSAEFESSLSADKGSAPTYTRASDLTWAVTPSTASTVTSGNPLFGVIPGGTDTVKGYVSSHRHHNSLLYSDQFDNAAWTTTNATVIADYVDCTAPDGTQTGDLLAVSVANGGVAQTSGTPTTVRITGGVWIKTISGSVAGKIHITDQGSEDEPVSFTATTAWKWFNIPWFGLFAAPTGNYDFSVTLDASNAVCLWRGTTSEHINNFYFYSTQDMGPWYGMVKTEALEAESADGILKIQAADWNTSAFTYTFWHKMVEGWGDSGRSPYFVSSDNATGDFYLYPNYTANTLNLGYDGTTRCIATSFNPTHSWSSDEWVNFAVTIDTSAGTATISINGVEACSASGLTMSPVTSSTLTVMNPQNESYPHGSMGVLRKPHLWSVALSETEKAQVFNYEKEVFGL